MNRSEQLILDELKSLATSIAERSYAPYSGRKTACVLLLTDGVWVPGVRVENASFPLLIPATMNAVTTSIAAGRKDIVAAVSNRPFGGADRDYLEAFLTNVSFSDQVALSSERIVAPNVQLDPRLQIEYREGTDFNTEARQIALRAQVPESDFRVGCILETVGGGLIPGCNVEHRDWNLTLCAERNAISTSITYGLYHWRRLHISCLKDPTGSPCGACRQVLVEHAPDMPLLMDRGSEPVESRTGAELLPSYFGGASLKKDFVNE